MSGHHASGSSTNWKLWILVGVLVVVIIALAFLCIRFVLGDSSMATPESTLNISAKIVAQDANGKDVTKNLSLTEGTASPETDDPNAQFMLIDIAWAGKKDPAFPMIVTISDQSFTDNDGLAVYHYANGQWTLLGTYLIKNSAVSFQADSFSPFAFQVISANPEPTATPEPTPEPTAEPEPTATPEPTPEPIDYGKYDEEQEGIFQQMDKISKGKSYVIALIDTENEVVTENSAADGVVLFGTDDDEKIYNAQILLHYDEDELTLVDAQVAQTKDGDFYILTPVVEGMLWKAEKQEYAYGAQRFSLINNGKYLNLDNPNENYILDEDSGRTRWLYEEIERDGTDVYTLTYRANLDRFFVKELALETTEADTDDDESEDGDSVDPESILTFTATATRKESMILHIFAVDSDEVDTGTVSGTLVLTNTPAADAGLDATPVPTATTKPSTGLPTPVPTTKPTSTAVPTAKPTATAVPTAVPTDVPPTTKPDTSATDSNTQPVPTKKPSGSNTD